MLYNALHIGDRLLNIEGITVKSAADAQKILQSHYCGLYVSSKFKFLLVTLTNFVLIRSIL